MKTLRSVSRTLVLATAFGLAAALFAGPPAMADSATDDGSDTGGWTGVIEDSPTVVNDFTGTGAAPDYLDYEENTAVPNPDSVTSRACTNAVDVGVTLLSGTTVKGQGSWTRCDDSINEVQVDLMRSTQYGWGVFIQQVVHFNSPASFGSWIDNVSSSCSGLGKQEWYVRVRAWNTADVLVTDKTSNHIVTNCS